MTENETPRLDNIVVTDEDLAAFLGVTTKILAMRRDLKPIVIGKRRLYLTRHVVAYLEDQAGR